MPEAVVRKKFLLFAVVLPLSVVVTPFLGVQASLDSRLLTAACFGVVLLVVFLVARKWVWVTVTPGGLSGHGPTWRKVDMGWNEPIEVKATKVSTTRGLLLSRDADAGLLRKSLHSLFIPGEILVMADFQAAVRRHTSPSHRLRAFIDASP